MVGRILILLGSIFLVAGLLLTYCPGLWSWFGRLPGDIRIEDDHRSIFIPITSMVVVSLILTLLLNLISRR